MNSTYYDDLEFYACSPTNGAEGYELVCFFAMRIIASLLVIVGACSFYVALLEFRLILLANPKFRDASKKRNALQSGEPDFEATVSITQHWKRKSASNIHGMRVALGIGSGTVSIGITLMASGYGTAYPKEDWRGVIGDLMSAIYFCTSWYMSLVQVRGANWFHSMVQQQMHGAATGDSNQMITKILDKFQGPLGPVVAFFMWLALHTEALSRARYLRIGYILTTLAGMRSFYAVATKRIGAVKRVATLLVTVTGDVDAQRRRKGYVKSKLLGLFIDLISVFLTGVFSTGSFIIFGSMHSSRQFIIHNAALNTINVVILSIVVASIHQKVKRAAERQKNALGITKFSARGVSNTMAGSVVSSNVIPLPARSEDCQLSCGG